MTATTPLQQAAIARVVAAAARVRAQRITAPVDTIRCVARIGERALEPQPWIDALTDIAARHDVIGVVPSLFDLMGLSSSERHYNRALSWLLRPDAGHGVGAAALLAVVRGLGCTELEADIVAGAKIEVRGERRWPDGAESPRMPDLLVLSPRAILLIENKVFSQEGANQYSDYAAALAQLGKKPGVVEVRAFLTAPDAREQPEDWHGMIRHRELATWIESAASSPGVTKWGRAVCLMVAEEICPSGRAAHVRAAHALLERVRARGAWPRDVRAAQDMLERLDVADAPWRD